MNRVLILGAGYAGLRAALDLDAALARHPGLARVTLLDANPYHQIVQLLHQTAADAITPEESVVPLRRVLGDGSRVELHEGETLGVDISEGVVRTAHGVLGYDHLVVALGSQPDYGSVVGADEHTLPLRTYPDALCLRDRIRSRFAQAPQIEEPAMRRSLLTFAIIGGGYTGCQFAGELAAWAPELCREHGVARSEVRIALFQRGERLLERLGDWATDEAERVLGDAGVSVHRNTPVEAVEPGLLRLGGAGAGKVLRAATVVWAGGFRAPALLANADLPCDERGRLRVDDHLRVEGHSNIYGCGDCARVPAPGGASAPATASYALRQGEYVAQHLLADMQGEPHEPYKPLVLGELVSLGPRYGVGNPLGARVSGMAALLLKKGVEQWYRGTIGA